MPIRSKTNLYAGINPHLNNFLRYEEGWRGFHLWHLVNISHEFDTYLPYDYYPNLIDSLQPYIYSDEVDVDFGQDIHPMCLGIFSTTKIDFPGELIARIELIAPALKGNRDIEIQYAEKRQNAIQSERCLIELDYLYSETGETGYSIATTIQNETSIVRFGVTDPIPNIQIYLDDNELFELEIGKVYNHTFSQSRFFYKVIVDYEQEPLYMENFTADDQQAIRDMMSKIQQGESSTP